MKWRLSERRSGGGRGGILEIDAVPPPLVELGTLLISNR